MPRSHVAFFRVDATVPIGHPLCGGWIKPAVAITEPLYAHGMVLLGDEAPVVHCAIDWTGICNEAHVAFRHAIAKAAHTTPERVALHAVHQHNAPFVDLVAQRIVSEHKDLSPIVDEAWFDDVIKRVAAAVNDGMGKTEPATHLGLGLGKVEKVASNRRLLGPDGKIAGWRGSSCKDAKLRDEPEGLIDPWLRSVSFWNDKKKLGTLSYYATHPMSYYGDGMVTSDFVGMAREARTKEEGTLNAYFTGCAGNVAAGKYNDGDHANRFLLARRLCDGMAAAENAAELRPVGGWRWRWEAVQLPPRSHVTNEQLKAAVADAKRSAALRGRAALQLAYGMRWQARTAIELTCLHFDNGVDLLGLPGECFIEHQFHAQQQDPKRFVAVAAYADGGPWYVPTAKAYDEGGYEPSASFVDPGADQIVRDGMKKLLA